MVIEGVFSFVIESSVVATILLLIVLLIRRFIRGRVSPIIVYSLWVILLLKFLIPFGPKSNLSIYSLMKNNIFFSNNQEILEEVLEGDNSLSSINNDSSMVKKYENILADKKNNMLDNGEKVTITNEIVFDSKEIIGKVAIISWVIITFLLGCYGFFSYLKLKVTAKKCKEKERYRKIINEILIREKFRRNVRVIETNIISSPAICGIFQGLILMPKGLEEKLSDEELSYVFIHELTHFKSGDTIVATMGAIIKIVHWFNPMIYIALRKINEDCELACDYRVLKLLNKDENVKYGNTIINVVENINGNRQFLGATSMGKNKKEVKGRIKMIARNKRFGKKSLILGAIIIAIVSVFGLTSYSENKKGDETNVVDSKDSRGLISTPDKIIIYENGEINEVDKKSEDYNRIMELTNKRFDIKKIDGAKDIVDRSRMNDIKKDGLGIELVYSDKQKLNINNKDYDKEIDYNRLYFQLESYELGIIEGSPIHSFQYGDEEGYKDCSYGGLEYSEELVNIIKGLNEGNSKEDKGDKNLILNEEKVEIEKNLMRYIKALNEGNLEGAKKETSMKFYDFKESEVAQKEYLDRGLGQIKSIEIDEIFSSSEVTVFVKCESRNETFGMLKENNQWKVAALGFSPRYTDMNKYETKEDDFTVATEKLNNYIKENNYKVQINSGVGRVIRLPKAFDEIKREEKTGKLIKQFNDLSIKEGYDFSKYLGQEVYFNMMDLENTNGSIMVMVKDGKVIGCFTNENLKYKDIGKFISIMESK